MVFDFSAFLKILTTVAPAVLAVVPGGAALAPLAPLIIKGIGDAQQTQAPGADKKAAVLTLVKDAIEGTNLVKPGTLDPALVQDAASHAIDAVITTIHVIEGAHAKLPDPPAGINFL